MDVLWSSFTDWIKEALIGGIMGNFQSLFDEVNMKVGEIATQVGQTPGDYNPGVFSMIRTLSNNVIVPIAGMILTAVLCYELIHMVIERNNMHDFEYFIFFKWIFKSIVAVYILTHSFDLIMGIFGLAQYVVNSSAGIISSSTSMGVSLSDLEDTLRAKEWYELLGLYIESGILSFALKAMSICIFIIVQGRMLEIYLSVSVAPIPMATMVNREWGQMGQNYLKSLFAVVFQGFLIMVCIAIYAALLNAIPTSSDIHGSIWACVGISTLLCFILFKTSTMAKSIFGGH